MKKNKNLPIKGIDPEITIEIVKEHGLLEEEYDRILKILRRSPTFTELGIFSVMWSEHCSYKTNGYYIYSFSWCFAAIGAAGGARPALHPGRAWAADGEASRRDRACCASGRSWNAASSPSTLQTSSPRATTSSSPTTCTRRRPTPWG